MTELKKRALIIVDLQPDFLPGGALAVPEGDAVIAPVIALLEAQSRTDAGAPRYSAVVATQDWHPSDHGSFAIHHPGGTPGELHTLDGRPQMLWPVHCVQGSPGAQLAPALAAQVAAGTVDAVFQKGLDPAVDSYSGFYDNAKRHSTGLGEWLRAREIEAVDVCGLALDYCVKFTVLDALSEGFEARLLRAATRAVNLEAGDGAHTLAALADAGALIVDA